MTTNDAVDGNTYIFDAESPTELARLIIQDALTTRAMDITRPLDLADESFDLLNVRFVGGVLLREHWAPFIAECTRVAAARRYPAPDRVGRLGGRDGPGL